MVSVLRQRSPARTGIASSSLKLRSALFTIAFLDSNGDITLDTWKLMESGNQIRAPLKDRALIDVAFLGDLSVID